MHFEQQPDNVRQVFGIERMETGRDKRTYLNWWNSRFPRLFPILHHLMNVNIEALAPFYPSKVDVDLSSWWPLSTHVRNALKNAQFVELNTDPIVRLRNHLPYCSWTIAGPGHPAGPVSVPCLPPPYHDELHLSREWMEWSENFFDSAERL